MPDPIADVVRGATTWLLTNVDRLDVSSRDDPRLHQAIAKQTGLSQADAYAVITKSWGRIAETVEDRRGVGSVGAKLSALSFGRNSIEHPTIDDVTIVRLDDTSWLSDAVCYRSHATDRKGRAYGSPRNPGVPPISAVNPRFWDLRADMLDDLIVDRQHGIYPPQAEAMAERTNEELVELNTEDPMSGLGLDGGISLTGGHHRTNEIINRVADGRIDPSTIVRILVHD